MTLKSLGTTDVGEMWDQWDNFDKFASFGKLTDAFKVRWCFSCSLGYSA